MSWNLADAKIDGAHKNYLTPEIWEETHLREIFFFSESALLLYLSPKPTFNGAETNYGIARILGVLLMNSCDT